MSFRFLEVAAEGIRQFWSAGFLDHGGESFGDLAFHVESFLEVSDVEFMQGFEMFGCEFQGDLLFGLDNPFALAVAGKCCARAGAFHSDCVQSRCLVHKKAAYRGALPVTGRSLKQRHVDNFFLPMNLGTTFVDTTFVASPSAFRRARI